MPEQQVTQLLVCAATISELAAFGFSLSQQEPFPSHYISLPLSWLSTGVGIPAVFGTLYPFLRRVRPLQILHIGIAGAYPNCGLEIGDVVLAKEETYADVGFELPSPPFFRPIREAPFTHPLYSTPIPLALPKSWQACKERVAKGSPLPFALHIARGCTVNQCTGTLTTGTLRATLFQAQFESMEGAAMAQIAHNEGIEICEVRAISNVAGTRDMRPKNIRKALKNLQTYLQACPGWQDLARQTHLLAQSQ